MVLAGFIAGTLFFFTLVMLYSRLPVFIKNLFLLYPLIGDIVATIFVYKTTTSISGSVTGFIAAATTDAWIALTFWFKEHTVKETISIIWNQFGNSESN